MALCIYTYICIYVYIHIYVYVPHGTAMRQCRLNECRIYIYIHMGWLRRVGALESLVSFAKEPYKRDDILQKRPIILRSLLIIDTPY